MVRRRRAGRGVPMASRTDFIGQVFLGGESSAGLKRRIGKVRRGATKAVSRGIVGGARATKKTVKRATQAAGKAREEFREFRRKRRNVKVTESMERERRESLRRDFFE